jgi:hypothetical protein
MFATLRDQTILMTSRDKRMETSYHSYQILGRSPPSALVQYDHKNVDHCVDKRHIQKLHYTDPPSFIRDEYRQKVNKFWASRKMPSSYWPPIEEIP